MEVRGAAERVSPTRGGLLLDSSHACLDRARCRVWELVAGGVVLGAALRRLSSSASCGSASAPRPRQLTT
eukprot:1908126-Rhodomonas_salina.1